MRTNTCRARSPISPGAWWTRSGRSSTGVRGQRLRVRALPQLSLPSLLPVPLALREGFAPAFVRVRLNAIHANVRHPVSHRVLQPTLPVPKSLLLPPALRQEHQRYRYIFPRPKHVATARASGNRAEVCGHHHCDHELYVLRTSKHSDFHRTRADSRPDPPASVPPLSSTT
jgi:hypothetical protein